ncbi:hypothetical protein DH2020_027629 [Rehmannia glutinosa]|uniref:PH domain-containing protein n=1 Tax=Rehmannia glutinosa TaxID=99300 RepID=A0ABR0VTP3_REHGL
MRVKEMHPLCCITLESPGIGDGSPEPTLLRTGSAVNFSGGGSEINVGGSDVSTSTSVAGILYKWTNYGKGWRSRWFTLRNNGVLSYSKTRRPDAPPGSDVVLIGSATGSRRSGRKHSKTVGIVHLKISSFRESKSDDRRFYIFTATKTLHLRTNSRKERVAWIQALISTRGLFSLRPQNDNTPLLTRELSVSTERLKQRLLEEGIGEGLVKDCEQIMLSEFSAYKDNFKFFARSAANIEAEASGINDGEYQLMKNDYPNLARGKYSEWSTTESSDDVEKQELEEASDEEETHFFDTNEYFAEPTSGSGSIDVDCMRLENQTDNMHKADVKENVINSRYYVERRTKLPDPIEKEKVVSLWSMIKDNIGKDLTRVCLPVYFNEPISSLQKCFEDLEYSHLLDQAYEHGKAGNSLMRILYVAAFAVSGYASSEGRHCKPFNPLLGETYEADFPEKGIRFFSEKVTTSIYNLILGNIYCDHHGTMHIQGNRQYSCKLKFKEQSILERNPHQEKLPPTDSRLRPDQRHLENGEFDKANAEKLRLEMRQRMSRKLQEHGWKPRWFDRDGEGPFRYIGGYWEAREQRNWDGCPNIFGEIGEDLVNSFEGS